MGVREILESKDFTAVVLVFPFFAAFIDRTTGFVQCSRMTREQAMHTEIVNRPTKVLDAKDVSLDVQ